MPPIKIIGRSLFNLKVSFSFIILYFVTNITFFRNLGPNVTDRPLVFLTAPFNGIENLSRVYGSFQQGLEANFLFILCLIIATEIYCSYFMKFFRRRIGIVRLFLFSVLASYILSALEWRLTGYLSSGTSIIGFCLAVFLTLSLIVDLAVYLRKKDLGARTTRRPSKLIAVTYVYAAVVSAVVLIFSFLIGNLNAVRHLEGLAIFGLALFVDYICKSRLYLRP